MLLYPVVITFNAKQPTAKLFEPLPRLLPPAHLPIDALYFAVVVRPYTVPSAVGVAALPPPTALPLTVNEPPVTFRH